MKIRLPQAALSSALVFTLGAILFLSGCETSGQSFNVERKTVDGLPTVTATGTSWAVVKVEAIDYDDRSIAIADTDGKTEIFTCGPEVRNFTQIKKGDEVRVEYAARLSAQVYKVNEQPMTDITQGMNFADLGAKPGVVAYRKVTAQMNVETIDYQTRKVTLKGPMGNTVTLTASPELKDLDKVKPGDQVVFKYVEAISINVTTP
jgi:Cu/Ag efflux protein CusF